MWNTIVEKNKVPIKVVVSIINKPNTLTYIGKFGRICKKFVVQLNAKIVNGDY